MIYKKEEKEKYVLKKYSLLTHWEGSMCHQKKMGDFNESIMVKMEFEGTVGVYGEMLWACGIW